ncbi:MAG: ABC transporter ATP-binding protein, partial [Oscillospiraceae bacterium]|nr:ABC transporter ATP-binding protein [Oscillospiraceae bacterium]
MKVLKHLKPYIFSLIIIFAVLFVQANCDLAMPDQMSNLVTVGLQQHGLEKPLPPQLKADDYNLLKLFMSEDNQKNIDKYYSSQKADGKEVFALKSDLNDEQKTKAAAVMTDPLLVYVALNSGGLDAQIAEAMDNFKTQQEEAAKQAALAQQGANDSVDLESLTPEQLAAMQAAQSGATQPDLAQQNAAQAFANLPTTGKELIEFLKSDDIPQEMKTAFSAQTSGGAANSQAMDALDQSTKEQTAISGAVELTKASGYDLGNPQINYIIFAGLIMLAYSLVVALCQIAVTYFASKVGAGFSRNLRLSVFDKVIGFSNKELNNFSAASLITRSTNDIQQVQLVVIMVLRMVLYAPIIGIGAFFRVLNSGPSMAWVIGVAILSILTLAVLLISIAMPKFTSLQKLVDRINLVSREILSGIPVIRAFAREKHEEERFDVENKKLLKNYLFVNRLMSTMMPLM